MPLVNKIQNSQFFAIDLFLFSPPLIWWIFQLFIIEKISGQVQRITRQISHTKWSFVSMLFHYSKQKLFESPAIYCRKDSLATDEVFCKLNKFPCINESKTAPLHPHFWVDNRTICFLFLFFFVCMGRMWCVLRAFDWTIWFRYVFSIVLDRMFNDGYIYIARQYPVSRT